MGNASQPSHLPFPNRHRLEFLLRPSDDLPFKNPSRFTHIFFFLRRQSTRLSSTLIDVSKIHAFHSFSLFFSTPANAPFRVYLTKYLFIYLRSSTPYLEMRERHRTSVPFSSPPHPRTHFHVSVYRCLCIY